MKSTRRERLGYRLEGFFARGGKTIFLGLTLIFLCCFGLMLGLRVAADKALGPGTPQTTQSTQTTATNQSTEKKEEATPIVWRTFMQMLDSGSLMEEKDQPVTDMALAILTVLLGMAIFSMLTAFIVAQLDSLLYAVRTGRGRVVERGHTLVLGWNERAFDVVRELIVANESEKRACIVVLAEAEKELMDNELAKKFPDPRPTVLTTRSGDPAALVELRRAGAEDAKSVVILASCPAGAGPAEKDASDVRAIKQALAVLACLPPGATTPIVAEIYDEEKRRMLAYTDYPHLVAVSSWEIMGKLIVQTSLTSGLEVVYHELLGFSGSEIYIRDCACAGARFGDLFRHFPDGIPLGLRDRTGALALRPAPDRVLAPGDEVVILAEDDSSIEYRKKPVFAPADLPYRGLRLEKTPRRILLLGWHAVAPVVVREYADYLPPGSCLHVALADPSPAVAAAVARLDDAHPGLAISLRQADPGTLSGLASLAPYGYDTVLILALDPAQASAEKTDCETLLILLLLRRLAKDVPDTRRTKIITQVLNSENQELLNQAEVDDFIISNRLITMLLAQLSEDPRRRELYDDLFREEGSEIYVKPATLYFPQLPVELRFGDLVAQAAKRDEICLGLRLGALARDPGKNFGVRLNPAKDTRYTITEKDFLVVLAEDEL